MTLNLKKYPQITESVGFDDSRLETFNNQESSEMAQEASLMLDLLHDVGKKVASVSQMSRLVEQITQMTQQALNAEASSLLLLEDNSHELLFKTAQGEAGQALRRTKLDTGSGIAGWVARHGRPLIVNDVTGDERFNKDIDEKTGFTTRSIICTPLIAHRKVIGVIEVINKLDYGDFTERDREALVSVASMAAVSIENARLQEAILRSYKSTINALSAAVEAKDPYTCGHSQRVMEYALLGGRSLSLSTDEMEVLEYAGILHDIGKIGVSDSILTKPGSLTAAEWDEIRQHSSIGASILNGIPFLEKPRTLILHHHERYDGSGYPDGLSGETIPVGSRLLAVADAFDTMTTNRSYRAALSRDFAVNELISCSGTQFCPAAVKAFVSAYTADNS